MKPADLLMQKWWHRWCYCFTGSFFTLYHLVRPAVSLPSEEQGVVPRVALRPQQSPPLAAGLFPTAAGGGTDQKTTSLDLDGSKRFPSWRTSHPQGVSEDTSNNRHSHHELSIYYVPGAIPRILLSYLVSFNAIFEDMSDSPQFIAQ